MVSTRKSPQKTRPTGVPTLSGQARVRAYAEPSPEVWSKVKAEKTDRSEFRANLKAKKYAGKEKIESTAFDSDEGNDGEEGKA